jgi:enamine deaminase RidA (YjgF/YER057c/UK114 family)
LADLSFFEKHPHVINGASELFAEIWGPDHGVGVRSSFGVGSLPSDVPMEIEAVLELVQTAVMPFMRHQARPLPRYTHRA